MRVYGFRVISVVIRQSQGVIWEVTEGMHMKKLNIFVIYARILAQQKLVYQNTNLSFMQMLT